MRCCEREHVLHEGLAHLVRAVLPDGALALVPTGEREPLVAVEVVQQMREVGDAGANVAVRVVVQAMADQDGLGEAERAREELHDPARSDRRDERVVVAGLHPRERAHEVGADPVVRGPVVEERANRGDALGAVRDVGGRVLTCRHVRNLEARPDQEEVGRIEVIEPRELRDRGVVAPSDRRERLARPHDVDRQRAMRVLVVMGRVRSDDGDAVRERHRLLLDERRERVRADDAVPGQMEPLLHEAHAVEGRAVVVRVDRDADPLADEQELEDGDVPAERAAVQRAGAEERTAERPERLARACVRETR